VSADHLQDYGGWPFGPDTTWLHLQTIALYQFKTTIDRNGFVAANRKDGDRPAPNVVTRLVHFISPTLYANEPGCDDLHWLDGTILRFCCDVHDLCYEKDGCNQRSWWMIWSSWSCTFCNASVVRCFVTGGTNYGPFDDGTPLVRRDELRYGRSA